MAGLARPGEPARTEYERDLTTSWHRPSEELATEADLARA